MHCELCVFLHRRPDPLERWIKQIPPHWQMTSFLYLALRAKYRSAKYIAMVDIV